MSCADLLFEIGTEELPPKSLDDLSQSLASELVSRLQDAGIGFGEIKRFAAPRRLALFISDLSLQQPDQPIERKGPPVKAAFAADGSATKAALAFADSVGVAVSDLERIQEPKGEFLFHRGIRKGLATKDLLPKFLHESIDKLPIAKRMRWGSSTAEFVRPVHWIVFMLGEDVVDANFFGLTSNRITYGHRFMAPGAITLTKASDYEDSLRTAYVIADPNQRKAAVVNEIQSCANAVKGTAVMREQLVNEVASLVEWPVGVVGRFEERFLSLPAEVLSATLEDHQRYFSIKDASGKLTTQFVTIANIASKNPDEVRKGNERVVRPRLADAQFFWDQDRTHHLESRIEDLRKVTFQVALGSYFDKAQRVVHLVEHLGPAFNLNQDQLQLAKRAALLAKTDLITGLVGEFPELQGTMGGYYASADGEPSEVSKAIAEHYHPRFAQDTLPSSDIGMVVALADKMDTITSIFAIGQKPSGTKDPYALRRLSLGVLRMLRERQIDLNLKPILKGAIESAHQFMGASRDSKIPDPQIVLDEVIDYLNERLRGALMDEFAGITTEVVDSVLALDIHSPIAIQRRALAVVEFLKSPEAPALSGAQKRIVNLFKKSAPNSINLDKQIQFDSPEENELYAALVEFKPQVELLAQNGQFTEALLLSSKMRKPIDNFFENVMVMAEDPQIRERRLALLHAVRSLFLTVADLSYLPG